MAVQNKSIILCFIAILILGVVFAQQSDCIVRDSILEVPPSGCVLPYKSNQATVLDKLILNGDLTINRHAHLKYRSMAADVGGGFNIYSKYEKIMIEDIGDDDCNDDIEKITPINMTLQSESQNTFYNIYSISNGNELTLKDIPQGLFHGVKILISSLSGKTEYGEVERVIGNIVYLKNKLSNDHKPWKVTSTILLDYYPQLLIVDEQRIVFKKMCLRINPKKPLQSLANSGVLFYDMKGLCYENQDKINIIQLTQSIFFNSEGVTNKFYKIIGGFSNLNIINIPRMNITDQTSTSTFTSINFYRMKNAEVSINSENNRPNLHEESIYSDCQMKFIFNGKENYKINFSQFLNSQITFSNEIAYQLFFLNSKILNSVFKSEESYISELDITMCQIAGKELDLSNVKFDFVSIRQSYFNGKDLPYAVLLPDEREAKRYDLAVLLKLDGNHFFDFEDKGYALITTSLKSNGYQEKVLMYSMVHYEVILLANYYNILPSSKQKVIFLPSFILWYRDNINREEQNMVPLNLDQYKNTRFERIFPETSVIYHKPLFKFKSYLATIQFDIGEINGYHIDAVAQEYEQQWQMNTPYYLLEDTIYKAYFKQSNNGQISEAPKSLKMKIFQDYKITFNKIPQIKLYFKSTVPIISFEVKLDGIIVPSSNYVSLDPIDGSLNIKPQSRSSLDDVEITIEFTNCKEGQFIANEICMFKCPPDMIPINNICQYTDEEIDSYYLKDSIFKPCLNNQNNQCKRCNSESDCTECFLNQFSAENQCQVNQYQQLYVKESSTFSSKSCLHNCQKCSDLTTCDICNDGFALSDDSQKCSTCPIGNFIKSNRCTPCNQLLNCEDCFSDQGGSCRKCKSGFILNQGFCIQECASNQYLDSFGVCQGCHSSCKECYKGNTENNCSSCSSSNILKVIKITDSIKTGSCIQNTCSKFQFANNKGICQSCFDQSNKNGCFDAYPHSISCEYGQYAEQFISGCLKCDASCKSCSGESTNCQTCNEGYIFVSGNSGKCQMCPQGKFYSGETSSCQDCDSLCKQCSGSKHNCVSCNSGQYLENSTCKKCDSSCLECSQSPAQCTQCLTGQLLMNGKCNKCDSSCLECESSPQQCTKCYYGKYLSSDKCVDDCPIDQFKDEKEGLCVGCDYTICKTCEGSKDRCITCNDNLLLQDNQCVQNCLDGYGPKENKCVKLIAQESSSLSSGEIIGIVFGSLIGFILISLFIVKIYRSKGYKQLEQIENKSENVDPNNQLQIQHDLEAKDTTFDDQNSINQKGTKFDEVKIIE